MSANENGGTIKLQQMKCPSCGNNITQFTPFASTVECPFCHQKSLNPLVTTKSERIPERFVPFTADENDFGNELLDVLINAENVPIDVFGKISFDKVMKAYLPTYLYQGGLETSWSCEEVYYETVTRYRTVNGKREPHDEQERRTRHVNGTAHGNFSVLVLAYEGEDVPEELLDFAQTCDYEEGTSRPFVAEELGLDQDRSIITLENNTDPQTQWGKYGQERAEEIGEEMAEDEAPEDREDFKSNTRCTLDVKGQYVMAPFYFVYYTFGDDRYYFVMDGNAREHDYADLPVDPSIEGKTDFLKKLPTYVFGAALVIIEALMFFVNHAVVQEDPEAGGLGTFLTVGFVAALCVYFAAILICWAVLKAYDSKNIEDRVKAARSAFPESEFLNKFKAESASVPLSSFCPSVFFKKSGDEDDGEED